jgi:hypothetical protein
LVPSIISPGDDGAVTLEGRREIPSRGDGGDPGEAGRDVALAVTVISPGDDRAVALEGHRVVTTRGHGLDA